METLNLNKLIRNLERDGCHVAILPRVVNDVVDPRRAELRVEKNIFGKRYAILIVINIEEFELSLYRETAEERLEGYIREQFRSVMFELTRKENKDD